MHSAELPGEPDRFRTAARARLVLALDVGAQAAALLDCQAPRQFLDDQPLQGLADGEHLARFLLARIGDSRAAVMPQPDQSLAREPAERIDHYPHEFSGGQCQRISIARALATEADLLVCDEPTSALDVSVQVQVLNLMRALQSELGLDYVFIIHNLALVRHMSDDLAVMHLGRFVETGSAGRVFEAARHPYGRLLLETIPDIEAPNRDPAPMTGEVPKPIDRPRGCTFSPRCSLATDLCRQDGPDLREFGDALVACHHAA